MSLAEIKQEIDALNATERAELLHYLRVKWQRDDPEWRAELDRRLEEVSNGYYVTKEELQERYGRLADWIVENLAHDIPPDIAAAQISEVRRRIAQVESDEVAIIPGEEALARVRQMVASARGAS